MKKQILTGVESFEKVIEGDYFYIDKTLFIKELLENRGENTLITRPSRFGKTLNMSMLKSFFDITMDSNALFSGLSIMEHTGIVEKHLNKYPVIFLTLKNVELATYTDFMEKIRILVSAIYLQNLYICENDGLNKFKKKDFFRYCSKAATEAELRYALYFLTECLYTYHKKRVIILLDEYDAPISNAMAKGYYDKMFEFLIGFLGSAFKSNDFLEFGVLTGVQRISRESLASGFSNPLECGIMDNEFSTCFGLTEDEVKSACETYELSDKLSEVKTWYDGYKFGRQDMYNLWSIACYLKNKEFGEYWVNTGSISILQDAFYKGEDFLRNDIEGLLAGSPVMMHLSDGITYPIRYADSDVFWTLLLNAGYLKPCRTKGKQRSKSSRSGKTSKTDEFGAELVNKEVKTMFSSYAKKWFFD